MKRKIVIELPYNHRKKPINDHFHIEQVDKTYSVLPAILGINISTVFNQTLGNIDPTMKRSNMKRSAAVVISSMNKGLILLQKLTNSN